ncbi:MAG: helix-turn-helix transcriptional regulator [Clostridiales bacterium]|nr:helix-turn-helix transcriptional regulator [Clostridiales bacterium]
MSNQSKPHIGTDELFAFMNDTGSIPKDLGTAKIQSERSRSDILYYRWDLMFSEDTDARKHDNAGNDEVQIIFNLNQDIKWQVGEDLASPHFQEVIMRSGEVCIYRNNDIGTSMYYQGGKHFRFRSLQMMTLKFRDILRLYFTDEEAERIEEKVFPEVQKTRITAEMFRVLAEIDSVDRYAEFKEMYLETKLIEITMLVLFGILHEEKKETDRPMSKIDPIDRLSMEQLREKIRLYPYENYDAPVVAASMSMSLSKMNRIFRELYDVSLHSYIQEMRLEYAARLLSEGVCNVSEAATRSGYNNMSYFSKAFKSRYGMMPKDYRERKVLENDL